MNKILGRAFFDRSAPRVAKDLLGKYLVRRRGTKIVALMITEAEAYEGWHDKASHAHKGETLRNKPMFGPAGVWYVYFVYGMHWMLNVTTGKKGYPAAVLIRGCEGLIGPARLTKALGINRTQNGLPAAKKTGLWIEDRGVRLSTRKITHTPRIGVAYAGEWADKLYRYVYEE